MCAAHLNYFLFSAVFFMASRLHFLLISFRNLFCTLSFSSFLSFFSPRLLFYFWFWSCFSIFPVVFLSCLFFFGCAFLFSIFLFIVSTFCFITLSFTLFLLSVLCGFWVIFANLLFSLPSRTRSVTIMELTNPVIIGLPTRSPIVKTRRVV